VPHLFEEGRFRELFALHFGELRSKRDPAVIEALQEAECTTAVERIGWPDKFVEHGSTVDLLRAAYGLSPDDMHRRIINRWRHLKDEQVAADV